jgi:serine/threonine protein kinase
MLELQNPKSVKLYDQGGHGCLFYPGPTCDGKIEDAKYITKIHMSNTNQKNEIYVSEKIKKIKRFSQYFSPIISSCEIDLAEVDDKEIKKCDFIRENPRQNASGKYMSTKTIYVPGISYAKYLKKDHSTSIVVEIYKKLLVAVKKLLQQGIYHYDIKTSNVIIKSTTNQPIVIDFGITMVPDEVNTDQQYKDAFYVYSTDYNPWPIDVIIISYLVQKYNLTINPKVAETDVDEMKKIIDIKVIELEMLYSKPLDKYKERRMTEVIQYLGMSCKEVVDVLKQQYINWDKYSVAIMTQQIAQKYDIIFPHKIQKQIESQIMY